MAKILVVDDDEHNRRILYKLLTHHHHEILSAENGLDALLMLDQNAVDLVLLDIMMPGLDGVSVTRNLRQNTRFRNLPIIVVSARGQSEDIALGLDSGANDYITKPILHDELLARVRTQLRLKESQDQLQRANEDLQRLNQLKDRLITVVSHELRTPLTSLRAALELIIKSVGSTLSARYLQLLDISFRNTHRLIRLVNDVLDFSRLEQGKTVIQCQPFSIEHLIQQALEEMTALGDPYQLKIQAQIAPNLPLAFGDLDRFHQVLVNLLSNAIKISPTKAEILIQAVRESPNFITLSVSDQGCGIAAHDIPRLFQPFEQLSPPVNRLGGSSGLGLVISKEMVERHGGTITVKSQLGHGSTFAFTVPVAPALPIGSHTNLETPAGRLP